MLISEKDDCEHKLKYSWLEKLLLGIPPRVPDASSGDGIVRTFAQCKEWAEEYDCDVKVATDRQLFIDIDSKEALETFRKNACLVRKLFNSNLWVDLKVTVTSSKSGADHFHIVIDLPGPVPLLARIALQAALGSDLTREGISVIRAMRNEENVVVFFEPK